MTDASAFTVAVAGHPHGGAPIDGLTPLSDATWEAVMHRIVRERATGLLAAAVAEGVVAVDEAQLATLAEAHERAMTICVFLERLLLTVGEAFDDAGVDFRVLKGPAVARLDYPDPAMRAFGDVDLLVRSSHYERALRVLGDLGTPRFAEPRSGFTSRFGKGVCVVTHDGWEIDLHRTFVAGAFGLVGRPDDLFHAAAPVRIADRTFFALDRTGRFVHACFHAALGDDPPRLLALRDVVEIASSSAFDDDDVLRRAEAWRARVVVARAVQLASVAFALGADAPLVAWSESYRPDSFERRALRAYVGARRSYAAQAVTGLAALDGWSERWDYTRALLFPERSYVAGRDGGYLRRFHRSLRLVSPRGSAR